MTIIGFSSLIESARSTLRRFVLGAAESIADESITRKGLRAWIGMNRCDLKRLGRVKAVGGGLTHADISIQPLLPTLSDDRAAGAPGSSRIITANACASPILCGSR